MAAPDTPVALPEDLIAAYVDARELPETLSPTEADRIRGQRRQAALAALQTIRDSAEEVSLAMHHAYRPEVVSEVAVALGEDYSDWEQIASWCNGIIGSGPDGTDSGEWISWITLPNGDEVFSGMWIVKGLDGAFRARYTVLEPDETTLHQVEALGWDKGAATALSMATYGQDGALTLHTPNPGQAFLPTATEQGPEPQTARRDGHVLRMELKRSEGLTPALVCAEPTSALCRQPYGECNIVSAFEGEPFASLDDYQGPPLILLDTPIRVINSDEHEMTWAFASVDTTQGTRP